MVEKVEYQVLAEFGRVEIRNYPEVLLAAVEGYEDNTAFGFLFDYIQGNNRSRKKIAMTAPVISSEKIPMTAPVISKTNYFAFAMPSAFNRDTLPLPNDGRIRIEVIPPRILGVLRFSGRTPERRIRTYEKRLAKELEDNGIRSRGAPFLMRYDPPFIPGVFRRNETAVEVDYRTEG
jgi:hypothetical protein